MMLRSDDGFSDCDLDENEDNDDSNEDNTNVPTISQPQPQKVTSGASSAPPPQWSSSLSTVSISDFMSSVGPTVAIPESPSKVFELMFTPSLMRGDG